MSKQRQRVLIVCDSSKSLIDFRGKLIEELCKKHRVDVFTPKISQQNIRNKLASFGAIIHESHLEGSHISILSDIRFIIQLYLLIKKVQPDVFFPYTFKPVIYGTLLAKLCRVKRITPMLTGLGYNFTNSKPNNWVSNITKALLKYSLRPSRNLKIIFQNKDDYYTLIRHRILNSKNKVFFVNGSGVDLEHYQYSAPNLDPISFIMVARLINAKGINEYYEAAKDIRSRYPDIKFTLIGAFDNNIDSISLDLFNKIQHDKIINYVGEVDDVRPHIMDSSVVVLPSYYGEGVPRCLLESMAMGRAIITCDSVGCRETIESELAVNGFMIPIKNVPQLISKMEFYLNNKMDVLKYGLNGLKLAKKKFDVNLVNKHMLKIMQLS
jgi:glycosyltransferase involved in cell wall biosynthesis